MIQYYQWLPFVEKMDMVDGVDGEIAIFTYSDFMKECNQKGYLTNNDDMLRTPHKLDFYLIINQFAGSAKFTINMEEYELLSGAHMLNIAPGQIVSLKSISDDFDAYVMIMSNRFLESLLVYMNNSVPFRFDATRSAVKAISDHDSKMSEFFAKTVRYVLADKENPYRLQAAQHVIMAIFYSSDKPSALNNGGDVIRTNADILSKQFLDLVKEHFRKERQLQFYADALCITPRYLSRVVKECTGSSAADWIERYVVLEARALLKSTTMNIQQISDSLNFPSQTFFGKYFKRRVGMSPKEYRRVG